MKQASSPAQACQGQGGLGVDPAGYPGIVGRWQERACEPQPDIIAVAEGGHHSRHVSTYARVTSAVTQGTGVDDDLKPFMSE